MALEPQNLKDPQDRSVRVSAGEVTEPTAEHPLEAQEPLTPQRQLSENRRNDVLIAGGVVVLAAILACHKINNGDFWVHLKSGWYMGTQGSIPETDPFSYTAEGRPWVNPSWLYDRAVYALQSALQRTRLDGKFDDEVSGAMPSVGGEETATVAAAPIGEGIGA